MTCYSLFIIMFGSVWYFCGGKNWKKNYYFHLKEQKVSKISVCWRVNVLSTFLIKLLELILGVNEKCKKKGMDCSDMFHKVLINTDFVHWFRIIAKLRISFLWASKFVYLFICSGTRPIPLWTTTSKYHLNSFKSNGFKFEKVAFLTLSPSLESREVYEFTGSDDLLLCPLLLLLIKILESLVWISLASSINLSTMSCLVFIINSSTSSCVKPLVGIGDKASIMISPELSILSLSLRKAW